MSDQQIHTESDTSSAVTSLALFDSQMRYVAVSERWMKDYGHEQASIIGRQLYDVFPEITQRWKEIHDRALRGESSTSDKELIVSENGTQRWERWSAMPWYGPTGAIGGVLVCSEDITAKKIAEDAVRLSERRFRAFTLAAFDVVYCMSPDWTHMKFLNGRDFVASTNGRSEDWLLRYIPKEDRELVTESIDAAIRDKKLADLEHRVIQADGTIGWAHSRAIPILDTHGMIVEWIGAARDITVRRDSVSSLQEREEHLRAILSTVGDTILTTDAHGIITSVNLAIEAMFGHMQSDLLGRSIKDLISESDSDAFAELLSRYTRTGESPSLDRHLRVAGKRRDGAEFPMDLVVTEIDHQKSFVVVIRDMSEQRRSEERVRIAERMSSIGTLAAGLGHDMNNALFPVRARLDILDRADLYPAMKDQLLEIRKSMSYLQDLSNALHMLALNPDSPEPESGSIDLREWWKHTRTLLLHAIDQSIDFSEAIEPDLPRIPLPPHRLTQSILNLFVNANKALEGVRDPRIEFWAQRGPDSSVRIGVSDNGCGMEPRVRQRALEPFYTTKTRGMGTGLGLSLVHAVATSVAGLVEIDSEPGIGTTIVMQIPSAARDDTGRPGPERFRVLMSVEDPRMGSLVSQLLEGTDTELIRGIGHPVHKIDLWITDVHPDAPELEQARKCCRRIIVLTALAERVVDPDGVTTIDPRNFDSLRSAITNAMRRNDS